MSAVTAGWTHRDAETAYELWRAQWTARAEQAQRLSDSSGEDRWASRVDLFSPRAEAPGELATVASLLRPEDTLLDVGAGGGRWSVPLADVVAEVRALDGSLAMTEALERAAVETTNLTALPAAFWPPNEPQGQSDVVFSSHVIYFTSEIESFLDAYEAHAERLCIVVAGEHGGGAPPPALFERVHGEPLARVPALNELMTVLTARRTSFELRQVAVSAVLEGGDPLALMRGRLAVREGSKQDAILLREIERAEAEGRSLNASRATGVLSWVPP